MSRPVWASTFAVTGTTLVLTLGTSVLLARALGPEGRGAITAISIWPALIVGICSFSLNESTVYHLASPEARASRKISATIATTAMTMQAVVGGVTMLIAGLLVAPLLGSGRAAYAGGAIVYALFFTALSFMNLHQKALLQGGGRFNRFNAVRLAQPVGYLAALVLLILLNRMAWGWVLAAMLAGSVAAVLVGGGAGQPAFWSFDRATALDIFKVGARLQAANLLVYAAQEADKVMVVRLMRDADVGLYTTALAVASVGFSLVSQTLTILLFPAVAGAESRERKQALLCRYTQAAILALVAVNGVVAVLCPIAIPLVFGHAFAPAVGVAQALLVGLSFKGLRYSVDQALRASRAVTPGIIGESLSLLTLILVAPIAVPALGVQGVAWSLSLGQFLSCALVCVAAVRRFNVPLVRLFGISDGQYGSLVSAAWHAAEAFLPRRA